MSDLVFNQVRKMKTLKLLSIVLLITVTGCATLPDRQTAELELKRTITVKDDYIIAYRKAIQAILIRGDCRIICQEIQSGTIIAKIHDAIYVDIKVDKQPNGNGLVIEVAVAESSAEAVAVIDDFVRNYEKF